MDCGTLIRQSDKAFHHLQTHGEDITIVGMHGAIKKVRVRSAPDPYSINIFHEFLAEVAEAL